MVDEYRREFDVQSDGHTAEWTAGKRRMRFSAARPQSITADIELAVVPTYHAV
jgi:hypothetical protein